MKTKRAMMVGVVVLGALALGGCLWDADTSGLEKSLAEQKAALVAFEGEQSARVAALNVDLEAAKAAAATAAASADQAGQAAAAKAIEQSGAAIASAEAAKAKAAQAESAIDKAQKVLESAHGGADWTGGLSAVLGGLPPPWNALAIGVPLAGLIWQTIGKQKALAAAKSIINGMDAAHAGNPAPVAPAAVMDSPHFLEQLTPMAKMLVATESVTP